MKREDSAHLAEPKLAQAVAAKTAEAVRLLTAAARDFAPIVFASSLGAEDMVLTDLIWTRGLDIEIFTLDTGRLPIETHELIATAEKHYGRRLDIQHPEHESVARYVHAYGINGFYDSLAARQA
ncbi:MAG: phosphoadenosine phosphosulfate reductase family protein, partial [Rhodocyclaceae bacterium]|nr:phosphoadenosine phosphosulfate reductase family protein [Rhodocyclaceae bacterium]